MIEYADLMTDASSRHVALTGYNITSKFQDSLTMHSFVMEHFETGFYEAW